jgi:hypothetical protein
VTPTTARCAAAAFPVVAALLCLGCDDTDHERSEFVIECTNECAANVDREICTPYCECAYGYVQEHPSLQSQIEDGEASFTGASSPEAIGMLAECGSEMYDHKFRSSWVEVCSENAPEEECARDADCVLRELRGPGPREESTRWLLENMGAEPNAAAQERLQSAQAMCLESD